MIFINNKEVKFFRFPCGEYNVKILEKDLSDKLIILAKIKNSDTIIKLLIVVDAINRLKKNVKIHLIIPYFPYTRNDKVFNKGESFTLKVITNLINSLNCTTVTVYDPHSSVTTELLKNSKSFSLLEIIKNSILVDKILKNNLILVSPDRGSSYKVKVVSQMLQVKAIFAKKFRDKKSGKISFEEIGEWNIYNKNCIILDDICDSGSTAIELNKTLKKMGAKDVYLYITHGIFSRGIKIFKKYFKHMYCYHAFLRDPDMDFLTILNKNI